MARIIKDRFLFIHAAKTGGTFFREALNYFGVPNYEMGKKHASIHESGWTPQQELIPVMFVRHPIGWYRSRWRFAKMTYFDKKIEYMPEAQEHWMAKVWSNNYIDFVSNIIDTFPNGIANEYFTGMLAGAHSPQVYKYEELMDRTYDFLRFACGVPRLIMDDILTMPRMLDSSQIFYEELPDAMLTKILEIEKDFIKRYYK